MLPHLNISKVFTETIINKIEPFHDDREDPYKAFADICINAPLMISQVQFMEFTKAHHAVSLAVESRYGKVNFGATRLN